MMVKGVFGCDSFVWVFLEKLHQEVDPRGAKVPELGDYVVLFFSLEFLKGGEIEDVVESIGSEVFFNGLIRKLFEDHEVDTDSKTEDIHRRTIVILIG